MKKSILLWSCLMLFIISPTATVALAGDWTEVPFPAEEVYYLAEDNEGNLWAIPSISKVDVYVLKKDGDSWQDASEGLDKSTPTAITDFQTFGDKLFLQTAHDIYIRDINDAQWHKLEGHPYYGLTASSTYLVEFEGYIWSEYTFGITRLDPEHETWSEMKQGMPGRTGAYYFSNLAATGDYLYVGTSDAKKVDPTYSGVEVYRINSANGSWEKTGLKITPTPAELEILARDEDSTWGILHLATVDGYVLAVVSPVTGTGDALPENRHFIYSEQSASWSPLPETDETLLASELFPYWPPGNNHKQNIPVDENKFYFLSNVDEKSSLVTYDVFNPQSFEWEDDLTVPAAHWSPVKTGVVYYIDDRIVIQDPPAGKTAPAASSGKRNIVLLIALAVIVALFAVCTYWYLRKRATATRH